MERLFSKKNKLKMKINLFISIVVISFLACNKVEYDVTPSSTSSYKTENVIIVVVDGVRYIDSWNNSHTENILYQRALTVEGTFFPHFYNEGPTFTVSGHTAICTGYYEDMENSGHELPSHPSIFQQFLSETELPPSRSYIITGKEKLNVLGNSKNIHWKNRYTPSVDAVDREDSITLKSAKRIFTEEQPVLSLVHFKGPDYYGHHHNWEKYISSIQESDNYVFQLWNFIQEDEHYKNKTTLLVTSDHGRHLDEIETGFFDHGDRCNGCKHIYLLGLGPDFEKGLSVVNRYDQLNLAPTIATLLNFEFRSDAVTIKELTSTHNEIF